MLTAVEETARDGIKQVAAIREAFLEMKHGIRAGSLASTARTCSTCLFTHPYTKIEFVKEALNVSRPTTAKYLNTLAGVGILVKRRMGRSNYYINPALYSVLTGDSLPEVPTPCQHHLSHRSIQEAPAGHPNRTSG